MQMTVMFAISSGDECFHQMRNIIIMKCLCQREFSMNYYLKSFSIIELPFDKRRGCESIALDLLPFSSLGG